MHLNDCIDLKITKHIFCHVYIFFNNQMLRVQGTTKLWSSGRFSLNVHINPYSKLFWGHPVYNLTFF